MITRPSDLKAKEKLTIANVSDEKLINIIGQLMSTYKRYRTKTCGVYSKFSLDLFSTKISFVFRFVEGQIEMEQLEHTAMEEELNKPEYGMQNAIALCQGCESRSASIFRLGSGSRRKNIEK